MELVDMQDLKFCLSRGPGSSPGTGKFLFLFYFSYLILFFLNFILFLIFLIFILNIIF